VVGNRDQHHIHILQSQQLAVVGEAPGVGRVFLGAVDLLAVNVAQRRHIGVARLDELPHVAPAALPAANETELHPVVSPENSGIGKRRGGGHTTQEGPSGTLVSGIARLYCVSARRQVQSVARSTSLEAGACTIRPYER